MARLTLNIDAETIENTNTTFDPVPQGRYEVSIYEVELQEVKTGENAGKPRLHFQFRIQDGETSPEGAKQGNRRLFHGANAFTSPNKKDPSKTNLPYDLIGIGKAIGLTSEQINDIDTDDWLGGELEVQVLHEPKYGKNPATGKYDVETGEVREILKGFRSIEAASTATISSTTVKSAAGVGKAKLSGGFSL